MKTLLNQTDKAEILERLGNLQPSSERRWGKMSAHQAICHLLDSFRLATGEKKAGTVDNFLTRSVVKWIAVHTPLPWARGIKTMPEMDQQIGGTPPIEFAQDRRALEAMIERLTQQPRDFQFGYHPFFGEMTESEWMVWGWRHCDHHLRQFGV
jgi:Protein of unknown function (DUF1569)